MNEIKASTSNLMIEDLDKLFKQTRNEDENRNKLRRYYTSSKIYSVIVLILIMLAVYCGIRAFVKPQMAELNPNWKTYIDILNKKEKEKWLEKKQDKNAAYIQINQIITIAEDGTKANIRLINPPYSACDMEVTVQLEDGQKLFYQSDRLKPGTLIEYIDLTKREIYEDEKAMAIFWFYDGKGNLLREEKLELTLKSQ